MTAKRFKVRDNTDNPFFCDWSVTDYADGGIVHHPMTSENMANVMCDLLNEQHETNRKQSEIIEWLIEALRDDDKIFKEKDISYIVNNTLSDLVNGKITVTELLEEWDND